MSSDDFSAGKGFGERLRAIREKRGLTQGEVGARAGIAAAGISHFETGQRLPSLDSLAKLADALEVSADALLGRETSEVAHVDPLFLRASQASSEVLDTVKRVTAALLREATPRGTRR